jgi:hypothetical protein
MTAVVVAVVVIRSAGETPAPTAAETAALQTKNRLRRGA